MKKDEIKQKLKQLLKNAYAPYSGVQVSSILISKSNKVYVGVNIENASYGATICAERSAIFAAISNGEKANNIQEIHIYSNVGKALYPCSLCLQVMVEFLDLDQKIYIHSDKQAIKKTIDELVPYKVTKTSFK